MSSLVLRVELAVDRTEVQRIGRKAIKLADGEDFGECVAAAAFHHFLARLPIDPESAGRGIVDRLGMARSSMTVLHMEIPPAG